MKSYFAIAIILSLLLTIWVIVTIRQPQHGYRMQTNPRTLVTTDDFDILKRVAQDRIAMIVKDSGLFAPYNPEAMESVSKAVEASSSLNELGAAFLLLPNNSLGSAPVAPLTGVPEDTTLFQFEQGTAGWYWGYATYKDQPSTGDAANIMYYIIRIDLGTPEIRAKYNLPLGATTLYSVSVGAGLGKGTWRYSPYAMCRGKYEIKDARQFQFTAESQDGDVTISFGAEKSSLMLEFSCKEKGNVFSSSTTFDIARSARFNAPRGCAPCVAGSGTLYWSYPHLVATSTITVDSKTEQGLTGGDGWLDHQWMRGNAPDSLGVQILTNISQLSKSVGGLGRYVWINVHLEGHEFMITAFPPQSAEISAGQTYAAKFISYPEHGDTTYDNETTMVLEKTTEIDGITFPTVFTIALPGSEKTEKYTISSVPYGDCVTLDLTGNLHWSGSASLMDSTGKSPRNGVRRTEPVPDNRRLSLEYAKESRN